MKLDDSWHNEAYEKCGYHQNEYLTGIEDFQKKVIKDLEEEIKKARIQCSGSITGLLQALEIIKNLKNE